MPSRFMVNDEGRRVKQAPMTDDFEATLSWTGSPEDVRILMTSLAIDDPDAFVVESVKIDENSAELRLTVVSKDPGRLRATMDDLMACLSAAEAALGSAESHR